MARKHQTIHDNTWKHDQFELPRLDVSRAFHSQVPGRFSRLVGVDGRHAGALRRFPGFLRMTSTTDTPSASGYTLGGSFVNLFKPFAVLSGSSGTQAIRGVAMLMTDAAAPGAGDNVLFAYVSHNGAAPVLETLVNFGDGTGRPAALDLAVDHQLLYLVGEDSATPPNRIEKLIRYAGSTGGWQVVDWVSTEADALQFTTNHTQTVKTSTDDKDAGHLDQDNPARYGFAYRLVFPEQGFAGPLSRIHEIKTADNSSLESGWDQTCTKSHFRLPKIDMPTGYGNIFSRAAIQIFRTVRPVSTNQAHHGRLFLEAQWEIPRETGDRTAIFQPATDYNQSAKTIVLDAGPTDGVAVGDVIYIQFPVLTRGADSGSPDDDKQYGHIVYRRKVAGYAGTTVTLDRDIGVAIAGAATSVNGRVWISKEGDGADTRGEFGHDDSGTRRMSIAQNDVPVLVGWAHRTDKGTTDTPQGLSDEALAAQPALDAAELAVFSKTGNPACRFIEEYENIFVRVSRPSIDAAGQDVLRWGFTDRPRKGLIPLLNRRVMPDLTDEILGMVKAPPFLAALLNNGILRLHRSGSKLAVDMTHNRHGAGSRDGVVVVGTNLYFTSPAGILISNLAADQVDVLNATSPFFAVSGSGTGQWAGDLASIEGAYDVDAAALVFLNTAKFELLIIWLNHGVFTHLVDVPFDKVVTAADLTTGGRRRALLYNAKSYAFHTIDAFREADSRTTFCATTDDTEAATYNGTITSVNGFKLIDAAASPGFIDEMQGHFVRVRHASGDWRRARIDLVDSSTQLDLDGQIATTVGQVYSIGAIPFQVTTWPLSGHPEVETPDHFSVRKVQAMGMAVANLSRAPVSTYDLPTFQLFERKHDLPTAGAGEPSPASASASHAVAQESVFGWNATSQQYENASTFVGIERNHPILVPGLEVWSSNLDFDLLGLVVEGKIEGSFRDQRPS